MTLSERINGLLNYKGVDFKEASYDECPEGLWFYDIKQLSQEITELVVEYINENVVINLEKERSKE